MNLQPIFLETTVFWLGKSIARHQKMKSFANFTRSIIIQPSKWLNQNKCAKGFSFEYGKSIRHLEEFIGNAYDSKQSIRFVEEMDPWVPMCSPVNTTTCSEKEIQYIESVTIFRSLVNKSSCAPRRIRRWVPDSFTYSRKIRLCKLCIWSRHVAFYYFCQI